MKKKTREKPDSFIEKSHANALKTLDAGLDQALEDLDLQDYSSSPLSRTIPKEEIKQNIKKFFIEILDDKKEQERILNGIKIIEENLGSLPEGELCRKELEKAASRMLDDCLDFITKIEDDPSSIVNLTESKQENLTNLQSFAEQIGIPLDVIRIFYNFGSQLFKERKVEEALCVFQFLSFLDVYSPDIWVALGMCHQRLKEWFYAVHCYSMASVFNPDNVLPYIYSAECFIENKDFENAKDCIQWAEHFITPENKSYFDSKLQELRKLV